MSLLERLHINMENETRLAQLTESGTGSTPSQPKSWSVKDRNKLKQDLKDANSCIILGAGVGAVGTISALSIGAVCPLCVVAAPSLIGLGFLENAPVTVRN